MSRLLAINAAASNALDASDVREHRTSRCRFVVDVLVAGVGLFTDSYDFSVINLVRPSLERSYPVHGDFATSWQRSMITASSIFGALIGQLVLGRSADVLGRRRLFLVSNGLTFMGAFLSAIAFDFGDDHTGIWT